MQEPLFLKSERPIFERNALPMAKDYGAVVRGNSGEVIHKRKLWGGDSQQGQQMCLAIWHWKKLCQA